jgi:hypothetical protein
MWLEQGGSLQYQHLSKHLGIDLSFEINRSSSTLVLTWYMLNSESCKPACLEGRIRF